MKNRETLDFSEHWPRVFSSAHGRSCYPGRRGSHPRPGTVGPQTDVHSVDTASWGWSNAAPQKPSQRRTSFSLQRDNTRERHLAMWDRCSADTVQGALAPVSSGKDLIRFFNGNICVCVCVCGHNFLTLCSFIICFKHIAHKNRVKLPPVLKWLGGYMQFLEVWEHKFYQLEIFEMLTASNLLFGVLSGYIWKWR